MLLGWTCQLEIVTGRRAGWFTGAGRARVSQSAITRSCPRAGMNETLFLRVGRRIASPRWATRSSTEPSRLRHQGTSRCRESQQSERTISLAGGMTVCMMSPRPPAGTQVHSSVEFKVVTGASQRLLQRSAPAQWTSGSYPSRPGADLVTIPAMDEEMLVAHPKHPLARQKRFSRRPRAALRALQRSNSRRVIDELFVREHVQPASSRERRRILKASKGPDASRHSLQAVA